MTELWADMPLGIQLFVLALLGACGGALANCILFACGNWEHAINPWAPTEKREPPYRVWDRVPIGGWWRLRRNRVRGRTSCWLVPLLLESAGAILLPAFYWFETRGEGLFLFLIRHWLAVPIELRYAALAVVGAVAGGLANYLIYTQAHFPRPMDPWAAPHPDAPDRSWLDRVPIIGWWGLRRESKIHGGGFWVRPLLIELTAVICLPLFYWYQTQVGGPLPPALQIPKPIAAYEPSATQLFLGHSVLMVLMVAATFIDFDEKSIPDVITIPGTLIALMLGTISLASFLPTAVPVCGNPTTANATTFNSPWFANPPAAFLWDSRQGLLTGWVIWSVWCFALADRRWSGVMLRRRGLARTVRFFFDALFHHWTWKLLAALWLAGVVSLATVWNVGGNYWLGLFSALMGLGIGGGIVWAIRLVASWAMKMEAMGFGDVTLMAMIGAFLGWQGAVSTFFLAPFAAIAIVIIQFIITRSHSVPFGPYLCAGSVLSIVFWDLVYNQTLACNLLTLGGVLLWLCIAMLALLGVILFTSRMIKTFLYRAL
ncbi:MAG: A24 family peptidase [Pirellulales bacterium]|nr:A24 family peptidase [Pirellulales bacterium]